ncbi:chondroitin AC/alginate lyase [Thelonectria olida]|uniref:Chondroitin AC/alginate lyase n=1 Tax=Thelonectria olida TaxID=1576542 RepID=A0A9P9AR10_9HYPO|nr:chondroitin AC/alginate lyase [Thelonectria olida]
MAARALSLLLFSSVVLAFTHPGLLVTDQDISRAKAKIAAEKEPWYGSWNKLTSLEFSNTSYTNNAVSTVSRSTNGEALWHDAAAAFNLALRWKISGEDQYAEASASILVAWAGTLESLSGGGDDDYLTAGLQGYQFANAAELLSDYEPFTKNGFSAVLSMMEDIFLPMNVDFIKHALPSEHNVKHFFANWELCNLASIMAIGVLADNKTTWNFAVDYFKNGDGNGAINNAVTNIVEEPDTGTLLGQGQESGRDQGHSALDWQLLGVIGQQAWNQGEDLYSYNNSRILLGAEYFARYNLGHDVPFEPYTNGIVSYTEISSASRGAIRPTWELLYAHYVQIKGQDAPWTTAYLNNTLEYYGGFEGGAGSWGEGSGHYDGLGWGSLLYHLEESDLSSTTSSTSSVLPSSTSVQIDTTATFATSTTSAAEKASSLTAEVVTTASPSTKTPTTFVYSTTNSVHSSSEATPTEGSKKHGQGKVKPCTPRRA